MTKLISQDLVLRKAKIEDLATICEIANSVKIDYANPQKSGFLVYVLSPEEYLHRIEYSDYFYLGIREGNIEGFLMSYSISKLQELMHTKRIDHEDELPKKVLQVCKSTGYNAVFGDQIAVNPKSANKGIGTALMNAIFKDMKTEKISSMHVGILHYPIQNNSSINFCKNLGFEVMDYAVCADKHHWGIYTLNIEKV